jgi:hypothetical protein
MPGATVEIRMINLQGKGLLLYLNPEKSNDLKRQLLKLESLVLKKEDSRSTLSSIRKSIFDLIYPLSPISKTRKIIIEILELTGSLAKEQNKIFDLITSLEEIYPSLQADEMHKQLLARAVIR